MYFGFYCLRKTQNILHHHFTVTNNRKIYKEKGFSSLWVKTMKNLYDFNKIKKPDEVKYAHELYETFVNRYKDEPDLKTSENAKFYIDSGLEFYRKYIKNQDQKQE